MKNQPLPERDWKQRVEECFLTPVNSPNGIPIVSINPDTSKYVVSQIESSAYQCGREEALKEVLDIVDQAENDDNLWSISGKIQSLITNKK
jgi:hypothetical protein